MAILGAIVTYLIGIAWSVIYSVWEPNGNRKRWSPSSNWYINGVTDRQQNTDLNRDHSYQCMSLVVVSAGCGDAADHYQPIGPIAQLIPFSLAVNRWLFRHWAVGLDVSGTKWPLGLIGAVGPSRIPVLQPKCCPNTTSLVMDIILLRKLSISQLTVTTALICYGDSSDRDSSVKVPLSLFPLYSWFSFKFINVKQFSNLW